MPSAPIELLEFSQRHIADQTGASGGPVNPPIMHADKVPVEGESDIAFDAIGTLF